MTSVSVLPRRTPGQLPDFDYPTGAAPQAEIFPPTNEQRGAMAFAPECEARELNGAMYGEVNLTNRPDSATAEEVERHYGFPLGALKGALILPYPTSVTDNPAFDWGEPSTDIRARELAHTIYVFDGNLGQHAGGVGSRYVLAGPAATGRLSAELKGDENIATYADNGFRQLAEGDEVIIGTDGWMPTQLPAGERKTVSRNQGVFSMRDGQLYYRDTPRHAGNNPSVLRMVMTEAERATPTVEEAHDLNRARFANYDTSVRPMEYGVPDRELNTRNLDQDVIPTRVLGNAAVGRAVNQPYTSTASATHNAPQKPRRYRGQHRRR